MLTITSIDFLLRLKSGQFWFRNTCVEGDIDFENLVIPELFLDHVSFKGNVSGHITVVDLSINGLKSIYWSNISSCYTGNLVKELSS